MSNSHAFVKTVLYLTFKMTLNINCYFDTADNSDKLDKLKRFAGSVFL